MKKVFFLAYVSIFFLCVLPARADGKKILALVPKFMNHPFFALAQDGCRKAESELGDVECLFVGPAEPDEQGQVQVVQDLISRNVSAIAIAPMNAPAMARVLRMSNARKIPIITWDSDLLDADKDLRLSYIGTQNYEFGRTLGRELKELQPSGGSLVIQSGSAASANLNERIQGLRDELMGTAWQEVPGTPLYCNEDSALSVKQLAEILLKVPTLNAYIPVGGWPQTVQSAYRQVAAKQAERIKNRSFMIVAADTLPMQMDILRDGLTHVLVGQRPFEMGYRAMYLMHDLVAGKAVPPSIYTGLDICTQENAATCLKK